MARARFRKTSTPGEQALIASIVGRGLPRTRGVRTGIGDDCAVLRVPAGHEVVVTTDLLLETTHFRRDWHSPESAGHRCLARGLSDLAAMGARPLAAFLSLAIPPELAGAWSGHFLDGLLQLAARWGVPLAGGDTAQAPVIGASALFTADIVLLGVVPRGRALLRSGARVGDLLYVTGALGGAAAELGRLAARPGAYRRLRTAGPGHPQLFPEPRVAAGQRLRRLATAAMDVSDGLSTDLGHLCESSGLRAEVEAGAIPVHAFPFENGGDDPLARALHGGEDYELLFTAGPETAIPRSIAGVKTTRIGRMLPVRRGEPTVMLVGLDGRRKPLKAMGWEHFRSRPKSQG